MAKLRAKDSIAHYERILGDLKRKIYKPFYLLMGEEPYYIDLLSDYVAQNVLTETERSFNQLILYGKDVTVPQIIDTARRFPMMANQQVVIVREAQNLRNVEQLETYIKAPLESTILVICYKGKTVDKRKAFYKLAEKHGEVLETVLLYDNEVAAWVKDYLKEKGCTIEPAAGMMLAEYLGSDLSKIANELDKLFTLLPQGSKHITAEHIEKNIGISKDYNTFELNNALTKKDVLKANRIVQHFSKNPSEYPMVMTISTLFVHFARVAKYHFLRDKHRGQVPQGEAASELGVNPFFVKDYEEAARVYPRAKTLEIISLLREYDMRSKGWNTGFADHGELLRELVFKIMH